MKAGQTLGEALGQTRSRYTRNLASAFVIFTGLATFAAGLTAVSGEVQAAQSAQARSKTRLSGATASSGRVLANKAASSKAKGHASRASATSAGSAKVAAPTASATAASTLASRKTASPKTAKSVRAPRAEARKSATRGANVGRDLARALTGRGRGARLAPAVKTVSMAQILPARPTIGQAIGLHEVYDPLSLHSSVALALDASTGEVLFEKNARAVLPIASISKLMTAMIVLDARQPLDEVLEISEADIDTERLSRSRLRPGTQLSRDEMLHLALMSSENRAANALGRHYPGGLGAFVARMNAKAAELGMLDTHFVEPTGLSSSNVSNALDLSRMVRAASVYPLIRAYSTASSLIVDAGARPISYRNTNRLIRHSDWEIGIQKTGYISEAGNCMVMQAGIDGRPVVLVLLDADGSAARVGDAERIRHWLEATDRPRSDRTLRASAQPSHGS